MMPEPGNVPYRVELPEFEGPLDLLLHLCKTHEIEIVNIPIAFITEKYLAYLEVMQTMPVDLAADYLVMAATLAYLKSRELVPSPEPLEAASEEEEEVLDPREELIRRLLEYQKYKDAAEKLGGRPIEGRNVFLRGSEIEGGGGLAPLAEHSVWKLIESFGKLLEKSGKKLTHDVVIDRVSISERITRTAAAFLSERCHSSLAIFSCSARASGADVIIATPTRMFGCSPRRNGLSAST